jgi:hypothetical protein
LALSEFAGAVVPEILFAWEWAGLVLQVGVLAVFDVTVDACTFIVETLSSIA